MADVSVLVKDAMAKVTTMIYEALLWKQERDV
jgi:hypothetical protein